MRRAFVLRVQDDDPARATALARALEAPLAERGAPARVVVATRGQPGTSVAVGLADADAGARWLAPMDVPSEPASAARQVLAFLERWGFIPGRALAGRAAP